MDNEYFWIDVGNETPYSMPFEDIKPARHGINT